MSAFAMRCCMTLSRSSNRLQNLPFPGRNRLPRNYGSTLEASGSRPTSKLASRISKRRLISSPASRLLLEWEATAMPGLFPLMKAELCIYPLTPTETQLDFFGHYEPPFGMVGKAMNAIAGYRIAEVSVHRFLSDVAGYLRQTLTS